jgi:hypothetical protein
VTEADALRDRQEAPTGSESPRPVIEVRSSRAAATARRQRAAWGDQGSFLPRTIGKRARAAEVPWLLTQAYDAPDTVLDSGRLGGLEVRAASTRGTSHRCDGTVRQDVMGVVRFQDSHLIVAVADGLGSASDSHRGAHLAVSHSLDYLSWALERQRLVDADLVAAIDAADRAIRAAGPRPEDRASTLTVAVVTVEPSHRGHDFLAARIGDSPGLVLREGEFHPLFDARTGEMYETSTACLPNRGGAVQMVDGRLQCGQALALVTDGVGIPLTVPEIGGYLAESWAQPPGPVEFLHTLQFRARSFDDDRSAVVVWAPEAAPTPRVPEVAP